MNVGSSKVEVDFNCRGSLHNTSWKGSSSMVLFSASFMHHQMQGSNFTTATTANAVTSSAFAVMPFKFGF